MTSTTIPSFVYTQFKDKSRANMLANTTNTNEFVDALSTNINAKSTSSFTYEWQDSLMKPEYGRIVFTIPVGHDLFDKFFNSPAGIRAQFYNSVSSGQTFQNNLNKKIQNILATYISNKDPLHHKLGILSLTGKYSKFWMDENEGLPKGPGDQSFPIKQWVDSADPNTNGLILKKLKISQNTAEKLSSWGIWAPIRFNIKFLGTFVDSQGNSWVAPHKETRGDQINYLGFS